MNGKLVLKIVGIATGGIATIVGGYFAIKGMKKHRLNKINANIEFIRDENADSWRIQVPMGASGEPKDKSAKDLNKLAKGMKSWENEQPHNQNFEEYLAAMESPEEDEEEDEDEEDPFEYDPIGDLKMPHLINAGEFNNTKSYYEKISLNYFTEDDVLADDRDQIIDDRSILNADYFFAPGSKLLKEDLVYIRNDEVEVDYEISIVHKNFHRDVLGEE